MIYFKKIIRKLDKYIKDKNEKVLKNQKIKTNVLKNNTLSKVSKNIKNY